MLLRNLTTHVGSQNWTAVGLDFIIVVTGIFVGLQADAWNADRLDHIREREVIEQLLVDFTTNGEKIERKIAILRMLQLPPLGATMGSYDALIGSGEFGLIQGLELKAMLVELASEMEAEKSLLSYFRNLNTSAYTLPAAHMVSLVPNADRSGADYQVDFEAASNDPHI